MLKKKTKLKLLTFGDVKNTDSPFTVLSAFLTIALDLLSMCRHPQYQVLTVPVFILTGAEGSNTYKRVKI